MKAKTSFSNLLCLCLSVRLGLVSGAPTVTIASGPLIGTTTAVPSATAVVNQFLGIPFAQSPPLRFAPPTQPKRWRNPLHVTAWKPACIQQFNYPEATRNFTMHVFGSSTPVESEDCLYLNIYQPSTPAPPGGRTVMFWIYGGSFQFGDAGMPSYDGSKFAAYQDVIVVTANYRTNVFGFSNSPELPLTSRNAGFFDQRMALQWVQDNIYRFGGDPSKVTVFGESAGAFSIDRLITTMPNHPPFRAAILQSGQASIGEGILDNTTAGTLSWEYLVKALNCSEAIDVLACTRAAPALAIKSIEEHAALDFSPASDNITQLSDPEAARLARKIANVPVFLGTNAQEGRAFEYGQNNLTAYLQTTFPQSVQLQEAIAAAYPLGKDGLESDYDVISQIFTEFIFQCPAALLANASASVGYPTWRYYYNASFPNTQAFPNGGVYHSVEIPIVFGTYPAVGATTQEIALSRFMQATWANFAKHPTLGPGWAQVRPAGGKYLGVLSASGVTVIDPATLDTRCALFEPIYRATTM